MRLYKKLITAKILLGIFIMLTLSSCASASEANPRLDTFLKKHSMYMSSVMAITVATGMCIALTQTSSKYATVPKEKVDEWKEANLVTAALIERWIEKAQPHSWAHMFPNYHKVVFNRVVKTGYIYFSSVQQLKGNKDGAVTDVNLRIAFVNQETLIKNCDIATSTLAAYAKEGFKVTFPKKVIKPSSAS